MSASAKPKHTKPSGWKDGGAVWLPPFSSTRSGMRYKCKSCGRTGSGYGDARDVNGHSSDCSVTAAERTRLAEVAVEKAARVETAKARLYDTNWNALDADLVLRIAALLP